MHSETTLGILNDATVLLGKELRYFAEVICVAIPAVETDSEYQARMRNAARNALQKRGPESHTATANITTVPASAAAATGTAATTGKRQKAFNLTTIKLHSLGDYVSTIRTFGTTDSYSTQIVCSSYFPQSCLFQIIS